jgi:hypothetical protein
MIPAVSDAAEESWLPCTWRAHEGRELAQLNGTMKTVQDPFGWVKGTTADAETASDHFVPNPLTSAKTKILPK